MRALREIKEVVWYGSTKPIFVTELLSVLSLTFFRMGAPIALTFFLELWVRVGTFSDFLTVST